MEAAWNRIQLERPPNACWRVESHKFDTNKFLSTLDKAINDLESQEFLHKEAAILSRLIYRMKSKFRNDKGLKSMSKMNRALLNYLSLSLEKEYKNLKNYVELDGKYVILPTRQMLEYVLVRTQGFAKLILRMEEVSMYSGHFFKTRMSCGHAWSISVVAYAVVSRIWILSRHLIKKCCSWYNELYRYLDLFKLVGVRWLTKDNELPSDLKSWLEVPWINESMPSIPRNEQLSDTMFKLLMPREYDSGEELITDMKNLEKNAESAGDTSITQRDNYDNFLDLTKSTEQNASNDDIGEVIQRDSFEFHRSNERTSQFPEPSKTHTQIVRKTSKDASTRTNKREEYTRTLGRDAEREKKCTNAKHGGDEANSLEVKGRERTFRDVSTIFDFETILSKNSYPGLDKLQWNMVRKKGMAYLNELNACPEKKKQKVLLKKAVRRLQRWIT